jgi:hypothetical protein
VAAWGTCSAVGGRTAILARNPRIRPKRGGNSAATLRADLVRSWD